MGRFSSPPAGMPRSARFPKTAVRDEMSPRLNTPGAWLVFLGVLAVFGAGWLPYYSAPQSGSLLDINVAMQFRDLIVGGARRRENRDALARAREQADDLAAREQALRQLVANTVAQVSPAPKYAVPDVAALGPHSPVPPGIPALPGPGQYYASPALAALLRSVPAGQLGDRYPGHQIGTIGPAALQSPMIGSIGRSPAATISERQLSRRARASVKSTGPPRWTISRCPSWSRC